MEKTDYQKGYEDGQELIASHVNSDGKPKAKEYIQKLSNKNKGKTDAFDYFINNSLSYYVPPRFLGENNNKRKNPMNKNKIRLTESHLIQMVKEEINKELNGTNDVMDAVLMLKEAYYDLIEYSKTNKEMGYTLSPAMGNLRGAMKILSQFV